VLARCHARVQQRYRAMRAADAVTDADLAWLVAQWHALWNALEETVRPALWAQIKMLAG